MNRSPLKRTPFVRPSDRSFTSLSGRRAPLERRTGLDTSGGGTLRRRAPLPPAEPRSTALGRQAAPPASARRRRSPDLDVPADTRAAVRARSGGHCEAALVAFGCTGQATDVHHRKRRRDGGHAVTNLLDLCRACHGWAHAQPDAARRNGLIVSAFEDPATVPVRLLSRLTGARRDVLLTADGGYLS